MSCLSSPCSPTFLGLTILLCANGEDGGIKAEDDAKDSLEVEGRLSRLLLA